MNKKLTLSLDKEVIEQAKHYAKTHNISLSSLVENYLQKIIAEYQGKRTEKGSIVNALSGIVQLDSGDDSKEEYIDFLTKKYE